MFESKSIRKVLGASFAFNAILASTQAGATEKNAQDSIWGDETKVTAGFALHTAPRYFGAKGSQGHLLPSVTVERGIFFADSLSGVGVQYQSDNGFSASAALGYDFGRADGDSKYRNGSDRLKGMGAVGARQWSTSTWPSRFCPGWRSPPRQNCVLVATSVATAISSAC